MKKIILLGLLNVLAFAGFAQITYIGILNHNNGNGSNNLFNGYVSVGQSCYIDWEVYADGMTQFEACGLKSVSRLVLRRMGSNDPTSVVASAPIIVPGTCGGKNGNNDKYYANLGPFIDKPGRYSVEIQADLPNQTNPFENASTRTTFNYMCPSAYYLSGSGGTTGNYYTPSGICTGNAGLSDPVGGAGVDKLEEIFTTLKFFTVGEVGTYRQMVVFNGSFFDLDQGKFQPGNPSVPVSLNGKAGIPAFGICPIAPAPQLVIGGEINNFKRTDCGNADVNGAAVFYRVYKEGTTAPAYQSVALNFKDDCSYSSNGPEFNNFPIGGSCQNANGILDQRWQTIAGTNILPASFALADTGNWKIDFYTETYAKDCSGNDVIDSSTVNSTSFTVNNPLAPGSACSSVTPIRLGSFAVSPQATSNLVTWKVEEAENITGFDVQVSYDGIVFSNAGFVGFDAGRRSYVYNDIVYTKTVFYRLRIHESNGTYLYSAVVRVAAKASQPVLLVTAGGGQLQVRTSGLVKGQYRLTVFDASGKRIYQAAAKADAGFIPVMNIATATLSRGTYYVQLMNEQHQLVAGQAIIY